MFCNRVKEFLSQKGVQFVERDISQDESALADLEALGAMATPVTVIHSQVVIGFDKVRLEQLLDT
jgi:glutaredoxin 3